jgi:hypothetical protein
MIMKDETLLTSSGDSSIILTDFRIIQSFNKDVVSISLDKISCIKVHYTSKVYLLIVGLILCSFGLVAMSQAGGSSEMSISGGAFLIGAIFIISYFSSRKHVVSVVSDSGQGIEFITQGIKTEDVLEFINKVDKAKVDFFMRQRI